MSEKLERKFKKMFRCDSVRISQPLGVMFLIIGFKRHTKDDLKTYWEKDGKRIEFEYLAEKVIASGESEAELLVSAKEYKRLCGMTWEQYFQEVA